MRRPATTNFLEAWDNTETKDEDFTTDLILAEKETFELLAERGYETLPDYPEPN
jgi:hypothetical protein